MKKQIKNERKAKQRRAKIIKYLVYSIVGWLANIAAFAVRIAPGNNAPQKLKGFTSTFSLRFISFNVIDLLVGLAAVGVLMYLEWDRKLRKKNFRVNKEYGSAEFGNENDIESFIDRNDF